MSAETKSVDGNFGDAFRDSLYNVDSSGRRIGFYPKRPKGRFYRYRSYFSYLLLTIFFAAPWIKIAGEPLFLFNFAGRKFILFGSTFYPQDFLIFVIALIAIVVFVLLFTVVFGRLWCGWACPQTIFLEMVYRKIEYWIEGDAPKQRRLAKAPWTTDKIIKRTSKHSIFLLIAFLVSNTVVAYFIGIDNVVQYIQDGPAAHIMLFLVVLANTGAFYLVFSWFREQACTLICPYGRLQGVLLDDKSLQIAYDHKRGEPRGKLTRKGVAADNGDCIDCKQCVAVCPTGIDIRNGSQLECVNCTACIDACDTIMDKIGKPRGLVRFASYEGIEKGTKWRFAGRAIAYSGVLVILLGVLGFLMVSRTEVETNILRAPGQTYQTTESGNISNLYTIKLINKSSEQKVLTFSLDDEKGSMRMIGSDSLIVEPDGSAQGAMMVEFPPNAIRDVKNKIKITVFESGKVLETLSTNFMGPIR